MIGARRLALAAAVAWFVALATASLSAQTVPPHDGPPEPTPGWLSRYRFHVALVAFSGGDPLAGWDADFGGELDVVDFGRGRIHALANYEAVLGSEFQPFDPVFANYTLAIGSAWRLGGSEVGVVFEHVSRHLGDRPKGYMIAWNALGGEWRHGRAIDGWNLEGRARVLGVVAKADVDYSAEALVEVAARRQATPHRAWLSRAQGRLVATEGRRFDRGPLAGGLVEVGVRLIGRQAALEWVGGVERRADVDPITRTSRSWAFVGLRVVSRDAVP